MATTGVVPTQLGCTSATLDTLAMEDMERKYATAYNLNLLCTIIEFLPGDKKKKFWQISSYAHVWMGEIFYPGNFFPTFTALVKFTH